MNEDVLEGMRGLMATIEQDMVRVTGLVVVQVPVQLAEALETAGLLVRDETTGMRRLGVPS